MNIFNVTCIFLAIRQDGDDIVNEAVISDILFVWNAASLVNKNNNLFYFDINKNQNTLKCTYEITIKKARSKTGDKRSRYLVVCGKLFARRRIPLLAHAQLGATPHCPDGALFHLEVLRQGDCHFELSLFRHHLADLPRGTDEGLKINSERHVEQKKDFDLHLQNHRR